MATSKKAISSRRTNLLVAFVSLCFCLLALEASFYFFITPSDGIARTLAGRRWFQRYWKPINSQGYRDIEHTPESLQGKKVLMMVGDSMVAGHGIRNIADRFSDRVQAGLGSSWAVINIAQCGWCTRWQADALEKQRVRPDVVVLAYFVNDIEIAGIDAGHAFPTLDVRLPLPLRKSHLLNFLYWRWKRSRQMQIMNDYWAHSEMLYKDPKALAFEERDLQRIIDWTRQKKAKLIVLMVPHFPAVERTAQSMQPIKAFLHDTPGVTVVDLAPSFAGRPPSLLVVNAQDAHPNEKVHAEIAEIVLRTLASAQ